MLIHMNQSSPLPPPFPSSTHPYLCTCCFFFSCCRALAAELNAAINSDSDEVCDDDDDDADDGPALCAASLSSGLLLPPGARGLRSVASRRFRPFASVSEAADGAAVASRSCCWLDPASTDDDDGVGVDDDWPLVDRSARTVTAPSLGRCRAGGDVGTARVSEFARRPAGGTLVRDLKVEEVLVVEVEEAED